MTDKLCKEHEYKGYKLYTCNIEIPHFDNWYTGYVGIPEGHPLYEMDYGDIDNLNYFNVHGGWTYSESHLEEDNSRWFIGFDTAHVFDDETTKTEEFVLTELHRIVDEMEEKYVN